MWKICLRLQWIHLLSLLPVRPKRGEKNNPLIDPDQGVIGIQGLSGYRRDDECAREKGGIPCIFPGDAFLVWEDLTAEEIEEILQTAVPCKEIIQREVKKLPTLRGWTVATLFMNPQPGPGTPLNWQRNGWGRIRSM